MDHWPGRHHNQMELLLTFCQGVMTGEGRDFIGDFLIRGQYNPADGKCHWTKRYIGKHDVAYQGYNEGKGIWGLWEIPPSWRGGFHIWPTAMGDPTSHHLAEALDSPAETSPAPELGVETGVPVAEPEPVGASMESDQRGRLRWGSADSQAGGDPLDSSPLSRASRCRTIESPCQRSQANGVRQGCIENGTNAPAALLISTA